MPTDECSGCDDDSITDIKSNDYCGMITNPDGPFSECISIIDDPQVIQAAYEDCYYDVCCNRHDPEAKMDQLCDAITEFIVLCYEYGSGAIDVRNETFCPCK